MSSGPVSSGPARALVVGEALIDLTRRPDGSETAKVGGSPLNVAVGLSRLGVSVTLAAQVGDDEYGELIRDHVDESDVDLRSLPPHRGETATAIATIDQAGAATYEFDLHWDPSELPSPEGFDVVHVGSIATVLPPGADAVEQLVRDARAREIPVSIDPNIRPTITPDLDAVRRRCDVLLPLATILKCSDEDVELIQPHSTPSEFAAIMLASGARLVAVTRGGRGALVTGTGGQVEVEAPGITVADTIGAGDSFMAALLAGVIEHDWLAREAYTVADLAELGRFAIEAASITVSRPGADPPRRSELPTVR